MRYTVTERKDSKGDFMYYVNIDMDSFRYGNGMYYGWINDLGRNYKQGRFTTSYSYDTAYNSKKEALAAVYTDIHNKLIMDGFMVTELVDSFED